MKALIISDSHGKDTQLEKVTMEVGKVDAIIHCGDICGDYEYLLYLAKTFCQVEESKVYVVAGNCDGYSIPQQEILVLLGGKRLMVTHGHQYHVNYGVELLAAEGKKRGMDAVLYGHTHVPYLATYGGIYVANPGSISSPRQEDRKCMYLLLEVTEKGEMIFSQRELK